MSELYALDMENKLNKKVGRPDCNVEIEECLLNIKIIVIEYYPEKQKDWFCATVPNKTGSTLLDKITENITMLSCSVCCQPFCIILIFVTSEGDETSKRNFLDCLVYTVLCSCLKKPVRSAAVLLSVKQCVQWCV
ncbi:unnamed protein product [Callosobruchus maculatus]|uniref:Uncharacterized protein n=1 Tax=Callosobruchus maculatus TaxID=64391 RepID=A0A653BZK3_CALMS|nr:unnamed protein product [Callosobruchus maculatus]